MVSDQMLWAVYSDADPSRHQRRGRRLAGCRNPAELTFAFNRPGGALGNTVFLPLRAHQQGHELTLAVVRISQWMDPDLGGSGRFHGRPRRLTMHFPDGTGGPRSREHASTTRRTDGGTAGVSSGHGADFLRGPKGPAWNYPPPDVSRSSKYISELRTRPTPGETIQLRPSGLARRQPRTSSIPFGVQARFRVAGGPV